MTASDHIQALAAKIKSVDLAYYNGAEAALEDAAYDALKAELQRLDPTHPLLQTVGAPVATLAKVRHSIPMGSLDKAMNLAEFDAWVAGLGTEFYLSLSHKFDGGSVSLKYLDGALVQAVTRGDGQVGEDITANAARFKDLPKKGVVIGGEKFSGYVRGEIILTTDEWQKLDPDLTTNPRNLGNGITRRKDGEHADHLTVYAFMAHWLSGGPVAETDAAVAQLLQAAGFRGSPVKVAPAAEVAGLFSKLQDERAQLPYWIDGLVVKVNDLPAQMALGTGHRPVGQIALKFPAHAVTTTLNWTELTVGHTGAIIPTGHFAPVQLGGTTVKSALLCNWAVIAALDIAVGDEVQIYKAGEIIPRVLAVTKRPPGRKPIPEPTECPVCAGPVSRQANTDGAPTTAIFCTSEACPAKVHGKLNRYIKSLNILGLGDEVIAALIQTHLAEDPADLYVLHTRKSQLESLAMGESGVRLGPKRAAKILAEIDKTRQLTLPEFLGSLGVDGLGKRRVAMIMAAVPGKFDTVAQWLEGKLADPAVAVVAGVPNIGSQLASGVCAKAGLITNMLTNGVVIKAAAPAVTNAAGKSFCFTGPATRPRNELKALAESHGHTVKDDVSKGLDYLVMADPTSTSSKAVKARKLGTVCLSETEFMALVN